MLLVVATPSESALLHTGAQIYQHLIEGTNVDESTARILQINDEVHRQSQDGCECEGVQPTAGNNYFLSLFRFLLLLLFEFASWLLCVCQCGVIVRRLR